MKHEALFSVTQDALPVPGRRDGIYRRFGKRVFDITLSLLVMPLVLIILGAVWLVLRLDEGPVFYTQKRIGRDGKPYRCYKIRTMIPDAEAALAQLCENDPKLAEEWALYQKLKDDPRVTRFGGILRKLSIDELPQIFNVLKGEMSLVGPRPFMACQEGSYKAAGGYAYYDLRPGITGIWQVRDRGQSGFLDRVRYDNAYDIRMSLWQDCWLILCTLVVVLRRTGC